MNLKKVFIDYCKKNNLEINSNQIYLIEKLNFFYRVNFNKSLLKKIFTKEDSKPGFYLQGDVGVGKTMILNFFFNQFKKKKLRLHFNEFMIKFHNFIFQNQDKEKGIDNFVKNLKKKN